MMPTVPFTPFLAPLWLGERFPVTVLAIGGGTGNLIRRVEYDAVNGHEALRDAVIDDVGLAHHVRRNGHRTTIARTERFISVRMYHGLGEIVRGFTKNIFARATLRAEEVVKTVLLTRRVAPLIHVAGQSRGFKVFHNQERTGCPGFRNVIQTIPVGGEVLPAVPEILARLACWQRMFSSPKIESNSDGLSGAFDSGIK